MKRGNPKRIELLENILNTRKKRRQHAKVLYDSTIPNFNPRIHGVDADVILMLPDNGRRSHLIEKS
jgi:hypothetical protein